jgi:hypothetical protein
MTTTKLPSHVREVKTPVPPRPDEDEVWDADRILFARARRPEQPTFRMVRSSISAILGVANGLDGVNLQASADQLRWHLEILVRALEVTMNPELVSALRALIVAHDEHELMCARVTEAQAAERKAKLDLNMVGARILGLLGKPGETPGPPYVVGGRLVMREGGEWIIVEATVIP